MLLKTGSTSIGVPSIICDNSSILNHLCFSMSSNELPTFTLAMRAAMFVFPKFEVDYVCKVLGKDIVQYLMLLCGAPLISLPRLCPHDTGISMHCSELVIVKNVKSNFFPVQTIWNNAKKKFNTTTTYQWQSRRKLRRC